MTEGANSARPNPAPAVPRSPAPNYAARRMLASAIGVTLIVVVAVFAWQTLRDDPDAGGASADGWDEIALIDRSTGDVVVVDGDGEEVARQPGLGRVVDVHVDGDRLALVGPDQIVLSRADTESPQVVSTGQRATVVRLGTADGLHLAIGRPAGGNVLVVDAATGDVLDVGALAGQASPLMFVETVRHDAAGTRFVVADAANFQTILVEHGTDAPAYFADAPVAVGDDRVATSQVVGDSADIGIFDDDRTNLALVETDIPVGGWFDGDDLVTVSGDGVISRIRPGAPAAERLGQVTVPPDAAVRWVRPTYDGERLVVFGDVFEAVADLDGRTVFTTTFPEPVDALVPDPRWSCLAFGGGDSYHSLVELETGAQIADLSGVEVTGTSSDGCTVIGVRNGVTEVIGAGASAPLGRLRAGTIAPDGRTVVVQTTDGTAELVRLGKDLRPSDTVDLTTLAPSALTVAFLDR